MCLSLCAHSAQDLQAAAKASRMAARARAELRQEESSESGAAGQAQSGQEVSRPLAGSVATGSNEEKMVQSLHAPPSAQVVRHAFLRQSGGEAPEIEPQDRRCSAGPSNTDPYRKRQIRGIL
ncbi:MAG: hypothetical protein V5B78_02120 [Desulfohalobiaceae bacterium]